MFDNTIKFKYRWRPYQERVLNQVEKFINDKRVHIVAAPGSGKTILGLELARYLKNPVIIFAPTVTIKNQWVDKFLSTFTDFKEVPDWISTNIYDLKFFNVVTYQALHYAYKRKKIQKEDEQTDDVIEDESQENTDKNIKEYDIVQELKNKKITTICLDEAHHLKSQWWDSLKKVIGELQDTKIIALTATPPYDSDFSEWKKYVSLCGEIDAEITVPELVKAKNLCPHQDYIYFNKPTQEEQQKIDDYEIKLKQIIEEIKQDSNFTEAIKRHKFMLYPYDYQGELLNNVEYYSSMLIYLHSIGEKINKDNLSILGDISKFPMLDNNWFEILLKNIIFSDRKSYENYEETISKIESKLNGIGAIENGSLSFSENGTIQKYLLNSIGKLNSISEILKIERENLKNDLRMVVLTDFIRKEFLENANMEINMLGVIPIFRKLTQDYPDVNMAVLTGTIFIIPTNQNENLIKLCEENLLEINKIKFETVEINPNYSIVKVPGTMRNKVMSLISKLFSDGNINVIIGTKSLLGEGWDEPSINTLVLASFVGSFMLSNQMRGRAIRINDNPNKTANVWHLVCVTDNEQGLNADYEMLKRRFTSFVGLNYEGDSIENGIERLEIEEPFTTENIQKLNEKMKNKSENRVQMFNLWQSALAKSSNNTMTNQLEMPENQKMKRTWFINKKLILIAIIFTIILFAMLFKFIKVPFILKAIEAGIGIYLVAKLSKIYKFSKSENMVKAVGKVVLESLYRCKYITSSRAKVRLQVRKTKKGKISCGITGCTIKESNLFVDCVEEVFSKTENQRYIIAKLSNNLKEINEYYNVPEIFSTKKEYAEIFSLYWKQKIGMHDLVYTKSADGRRKLLKARMQNLSINEKFRKKQEMTVFK